MKEEGLEELFSSFVLPTSSFGFKRFIPARR